MARKDEDRFRTLLQAAHTILKKINTREYIGDPMAAEANYDGAMCDALCLLDDIEIALELDDCNG